MPDSDSKSLDLFGAKPAADALKIGTEAICKGAAAFLSRICLPAAEEFGLLVRDRISQWRAENAAKIAQKAEAKISKFGRSSVRAHPRLVMTTLENGSWSDDDVIQDLWAGILASSCSADGKDDSNIVFTAILSQLTGVQARIINYAVETAPKFATKNGLAYANKITIVKNKFKELTGCEDFIRLDRELDHLRALELIVSNPLSNGGGGFDMNSDTLDASIRISPLAINLYVRGCGFVGSPVEFFGLTTQSVI
ncbi:MAG: hypothetical protein JWL90_4092 [Chthoniobacteraceae bacterium]|nr:hypothetical protein [Chthoniobacteraceae bacterium]